MHPMVRSAMLINGIAMQHQSVQFVISFINMTISYFLLLS